MLGTFVAVYKFILNALPILGLRFRLANQRRHHVSQFDALDINVDSDVDDIEAQSPSSSYPNSDAEVGLLMAPRRPAKPCLKDTSSTHTEPSTPASLSISGRSSPTPSPDYRQSTEKETSTKHVYFSVDPNVDTTPKVRGREMEPETAKHAFRHPGHLSSSTQAAFALMREKGYAYKRWHSTIAGSAAGAAAILMEKKANRLAVSQQMFVRGLQGSFNFWSERTGISVPFGSVWVFALW